jgi:16S rRNA (cytosine1402-N4)-methyltransferase
MKEITHLPVLKKEVLEYLSPKANENFIDCTIGGGGHTFTILERTRPQGKILGIDRDKKIIKNLERKAQNFKKRLILVNDSFVNLKEIAEKEKFSDVSGILFDLGMSSWHLEKSNRGFSFMRKEGLDMRYDTKGNDLTAERIVNQYSREEIEKILKEYGEERFCKRIAEKIVGKRKESSIEDTFQLVEIVKSAVPPWYRYRRIHPATKTFQALRIAVNDELNNLKKALPQAVAVLKKEGRVIIISFHSLEDRIVKNFFKKMSKEKRLRVLTKKPIRPSVEEIKINYRSRSAKLRAASKI